jgi:gas vesicle protein
MGRVISFVIGAAIGVTIASVATYLFGPARDTYFDQRYRSRWDRALEEGRQAAAEHEIALRRQLASAKQPGPSFPDET